MPQPPKPGFQTEIRNLILSSFNLEEFRDLCFDLGVTYDDLEGEGRSGRVRELILLMERTQRMGDLLSFCAYLRPDITWPTLNKPASFDKTAPQSALPPQNPRQIFIGHAGSDAEMAHRLADDLRNQEWDVWIAPESILTGENMVTAINRGLAESAIFLLLLTPDALDSKWVPFETDAALNLKIQGAIRFIPLDVKQVDNLPPLWSVNQRVSFRDSYKNGLERLLQTIQPEKMNALAAKYERQGQAVSGKNWPLVQQLGIEINRLYRDYRETEARLTLARREAEREQTHQTEAARLYPRLKTAVENAEWANALALADQIDQLVSHYQDVAQLKARAQRGLRQQQNRQRQQQWQDLQGQLRRFSRWGLSGGAVVILLLACVGTAIALSQLINKDEDTTTTPSRTRPVITNVTLELTTPAPTLTPTVTTEATKTTQPTPSRTLTPTGTPTPTLDPSVLPPNPQLHTTWTRPADGMVMVFVPAGTFLMGSDPDVDDYAQPDEQPQHEVTLTGFWIDRTEVTNAMYENCVTDGECTESSYADDSDYNGDNYPVVGVAWDEANAYCTWAGGKLPTEAQWEYAARGDDSRLYPWGNTFDGLKANFCDTNCEYEWRDATVNDGYETTAPVGSFSPTGDSWDMAGNVWEWVADWYGPYTTEAATDPDGPASGTYKVLRGGSWNNNLLNLRAADRHVVNPVIRGADVGFRCAVPPGN